MESGETGAIGQTGRLQELAEDQFEAAGVGGSEAGVDVGVAADGSTWREEGRDLDFVFGDELIWIGGVAEGG